QAAGETVTAAADVYALGAVLYELLTGRPPYVAESLTELFLKQRHGSITPVRELARDVPAALEDTVMRALARDPRYRPESAAALAGELRGAPTAVTRIDRRPVRKNRRRWRFAGALALGAVLVLALVLAVSLRDGSTHPVPASAPPRLDDGQQEGPREALADPHRRAATWDQGVGAERAGAAARARLLASLRSARARAFARASRGTSLRRRPAASPPASPRSSFAQ